MLDLHAPLPELPGLPAARRVSLGDTAPLSLPLPAGPRPRPYAGPDRRDSGSPLQRRLAQLLDTLDHGLLLLADTDRVQHMNRAARHDLDDRHPLQLSGARLTARDPADASALHAALHAAAQRGLRRLLTLGTGAATACLAVVPLPPLSAEDRGGVAVLLGRRQVGEPLTVDWYARSHGLTLAETAVLKGLCADRTPQQIAEAQGVGLATVRTQIGAIRHKTGQRSIRALVRQVAVLPPLVGALQGVALAAAAGPLLS